MIRSLLALSLALLMGAAIAVPAVSATSEPAQAPTWSEGDGWAMGKSVDLDQEFAAQLSDLEQTIGSALAAGQGQVDNFDLQALASAYVVLKVADVTDTEVVLQAKAAAMMNADASIAVTGKMWIAGTYGLFEEVPTANKTLTAEINIDLAGEVEVEIVLEKDTSSVKSVEVGMKADAVLSGSMTNIPRVNLSDGQKTISYENYDLSLDFSFFVDVKASFTPALNLFDFPLQLGDEWTVDSEANVTGTYGGSLSASGIPAELEDQIFTSQAIEKLGVDGFPIDFAQAISNAENPTMQDGAIGPESFHIGPKAMQCTQAETMTIEDWTYTKYTIKVNYGESEYYYYDSDRDFLQDMGASVTKMLTTQVDMPIEIPLDEQSMEMDEMSVSAAEGEIQEISDYRADIAGESGGMPGSDLVLILIVVGVMAAAAIMVAMVLIRKKPKAP